MNAQRYWLSVAARDHALSGVEQGILQANHGKLAPLSRMQPGDGVVIYAPKLVYGQPDACQRLVALGTVADEPVYQVHLPDGFQPFRRKVVYEPVEELPIQPFIEKLSFIDNKQRWGYKFRFGCFEIPQQDFEFLHSAMRKDAHT